MNVETVKCLWRHDMKDCAVVLIYAERNEILLASYALL